MSMLSCFVFIFRSSTSQYVENVTASFWNPVFFAYQSNDGYWLESMGILFPLSTSFINQSFEIDFRQAGENFQPLFGKKLGARFWVGTSRWDLREAWAFLFLFFGLSWTFHQSIVKGKLKRVWRRIGEFCIVTPSPCLGCRNENYGPNWNKLLNMYHLIVLVPQWLPNVSIYFSLDLKQSFFSKWVASVWYPKLLIFVQCNL